MSQNYFFPIEVVVGEVVVVLGVQVVTFYVSITLFVMPTRAGWPKPHFFAG